MSKLKTYLFFSVLSILAILFLGLANQANALSTALVDSDQDGLFDFHEKNIWGTNPFSKDTDGDGYEDAHELEYGYDPRNPQWGARFLPVERTPQIKTAGLWVHGPSHLEGSVVAEDRLDVADELNVMGVATFGRGIIVSQATTSDFGGTLHNSTTNAQGTDMPVTVGDNLRIDGRIWRWQQGEADNRRVLIQDGLEVQDTLLVGGGYGSTGTTLESNGDVKMNGNLTVDKSAMVGGGYGNTGTTLDPNGNVSLNGNLQVDGTIRSGKSILINGPKYYIQSNKALSIQAQAGQIVLHPQNNRVILRRAEDRLAVGGINPGTNLEPLIQHGYDNDGKIIFPKPFYWTNPSSPDKASSKDPTIVITPFGEKWQPNPKQPDQACSAVTAHHITEFITDSKDPHKLLGIKYELRKIYAEGPNNCQDPAATNLEMKNFTGEPIFWMAYGYER